MVSATLVGLLIDRQRKPTVRKHRLGANHSHERHCGHNMAENIPPSANGTSADATRGLPYYEKLKRDLRETIHKKRLIDKNMVKTHACAIGRLGHVDGKTDGLSCRISSRKRYSA